MKLPDLPLVVLDTETTGFIPRVNRVIEFACLRIEGGKVVDEFSTLIGADGGVPDVVSVLTRIRNEDIAGKSPFTDQRAEIERHIGKDALIVGQNTPFDLKMLKGEGIDLLDHPWIDTSMLASLVFPELASYSLGYVSRALGLNHEPVHRALGDTHATLELLERCWVRLLELPEGRAAEFRACMGRSSPGYRTLASALPKAKKTTQPLWLNMPGKSSSSRSPQGVELRKPAIGTVDLVEEPMDPGFLQGIINACTADTDTTQWIAVKNLTATAERLEIRDGVRVLHPPFLMLDTEARDALLLQETFTHDEATLALKLLWYAPATRSALPIHGDEKAVWDGKLVCTEESTSYRAQFADLPSVMLIDHRQLLAFIADPESTGHGAITPDHHVIVDDASMLEDTATKAYGHYCDLDAFRAAATGNATLTSFTDALQIFLEKIRNFQDVRYLAVSDLRTPDASGIRERLDTVLQNGGIAGQGGVPKQTARLLEDLRWILDPDHIEGAIAWIEQRQDGSQFLQSVPDRIGPLLKTYLYDRYPTTLLIPPGSGETLREIIPAGTDTRGISLPPPSNALPVIAFPEERTIENVLRSPPPGKTVILQTSRGRIEQNFVRFTESLEACGATLIAQSLSGGQGRMQAEFLASTGTTIWLLTPWTFENIDLPAGSMDRLIIETVPFDHPRHAVIGRRAEHYRSGFEEYSLPRLEHRLFRLLRTFMRFAGKDPTVEILDDRLRTRDYGRRIAEYLASLGS